ncbi:flavin reductase family protein [Oharaeibacter diazotrophicus]|uniref:Flavin reductase (DIM6/NTAB) family NADH-FMN oxidoreductase RutF n=1 Tax=Oharaeibacter diazotrophicus TaxID=1920512 RepID=A0A4R6RNI1_9HYPH|nr:flavin reductase family protein [Oharaeibacter diazotrophicus]TDP87376.1 flavin reductase (DIM6/NTAB) family NADH-FMN oxidoreductase RutF [Oharaeibacter diazotrophicus]BBE70680.1 FMN reductase (NADH) NtaB [Pleomorphomonas sp. SM30]GLS77427.1 flavin reductase [Oharaeibacter diazotrophicus]
MTDTPAPIDPGTFWRTLGARATGMIVVTAAGDAGPAGFLGLSAAHVTADPATMLVSIDAKTSALAAVLARRHFAVNILPAEAAHVADAFGGKSGLAGADRFVPAEWTTLATGAPVLSAALGVFDCVVDEIVTRGSISIVIGTVVAARSRGDGEPLVFFRGKVTTGLTGA